MSRFKKFYLLFWIFYPNFAKLFWFFLCFEVTRNANREANLSVLRYSQ